MFDGKQVLCNIDAFTDNVRRVAAGDTALDPQLISAGR
jgi:hypothetical protein